MTRFLRAYWLVAIIIIVAAFFRLTGVNWDYNSHLHPDERFLTMVGTAMQIPSSFGRYLDPRISSMNPANIGYTFYVYGLFPVTVNKIIAVIAHADLYNTFTLQGRILAAIMDIVAVVYVFKIVSILETYYHAKDTSLKYWAAFLYAIAVLPIQLSHFFAVDPFLNTFSLMSVFFMLKVLIMHHEKKVRMASLYFYTVLSAVFWGLALSSKITAVFMLPLMFGFAVAMFHKKYRWDILFGAAALWLAIAYITTRIANPYMFETSNILNPQISALYIKNLKELKGYEDPNSYFPPIIQWSHTKPFVYSFYNMFWYAAGPAFTILVLAGGALAFRRKKQYAYWVIAIWTLLFFIYQAIQVTQPVRYFNILFPYMAILGGICITWLEHRLKTKWTLVLIPVLLIWPLAFLNIYIQPHSRISASRWIYSHIPAGKVIAIEHWDDALPISLDNNVSQQYTFAELPVFGPDVDSAKWNDIYNKLNLADYYIMSSNRAWRSIQNAPDKYPAMSKFYADLFAGRNPQYKQYAHFTSFPSLRYLGIPIDFPDASADETFTVYDHPEVYVFKKI